MSDASRQLDDWAAASAASPGVLPAGVEPVQTRLVRAVGRAVLEGVGEAYLKSMGFPRPKDRLRYAFRKLPAVHEADLLRRVAAAGLKYPEVVDVRGVRRRGLPWSSLKGSEAFSSQISNSPGG